MGKRRGPPRPSQPKGYAVRLRGRFRDAVRGRRAIVRNASLTARVSGNISATSGSRRTTLVPSAYLAAVTPRTAFEKSYSDRIVSSSDPSGRILPLFFFILFPFMPGCQPSTSGPLTFFPKRKRTAMRRRILVSPAPPSLLYLNNLSNSPQRLVYSLTIWEYSRYIRIKHHHIGPFGIPARILAAYASSKIIVSAHFVVSTSPLLHSSSAQGGLLFVH